MKPLKNIMDQNPEQFLSNKEMHLHLQVNFSIWQLAGIGTQALTEKGKLLYCTVFP